MLGKFNEGFGFRERKRGSLRLRAGLYPRGRRVEGLVPALDESPYLSLFISCLEGPRGDESYVCRVPAASLSSPPAP